jgi:uncharacterized membrane protein
MAEKHESLQAHQLERMIFFSDAVIAIAITLLIIEVHVPHLAVTASDADFGQAVLDLIPNFVGYFVSFFVIGAFWAGHHRALDCARQWSPALVLPNLIFLAAVAAIPFFTAFASAYPMRRVPVALYCFWLLVTALFNIRLQRMTTSSPVLNEQTPLATIVNVRQRGLAVALGAASALTVSLFVPILGEPMLITIPLWRKLLEWKANRSSS